ncbi:MAG: hypothetical protein ACU0BB_13590 [Paracoccaceae bacterium]
MNYSSLKHALADRLGIKRARRNMRREAKRLPREGREVIHFLHISKTGGTALFHALRPVSETQERYIFLHEHWVRLRDIPTGQKVVFFTRDPISRFVSSYDFLKRNLGGRGDRIWPDQEINLTKSVFSQWPEARYLAESLASKEPRASQTMMTLRQIRYGCEAWLGSAAYLGKRKDDILFIGQQEQFEQDCAELFALLGHSNLRLPTGKAANRTPTPPQTLTMAGRAAISDWYCLSYQILDECERIRSEIRIGANST